MKKSQSARFTTYLALLLAGLLFNSGAAAQTTTATLTFSGLQNDEEVREFYNGGAGSLGSAGGTNYGISFVINRIGFESGKVETGFTTPQIRNTIRGITINVPNGFATQVSFKYSRPGDMSVCTADVWSGLTLTGTRLANQNLPVTGGSYDTAGRPVTTVTFSGTGRSLEFFCGATFLAIDDITLNTTPATTTVNQETKKFDFDGDRRSDVSVVRIINGFCQWYIRRSLDNQFYGLQFGLGSDRILPLDFDGDGRTDIAVVRVQNGVVSFYILQSLSNSLRAFQFGLAGDDAGISADFDGDGKVDPAVFRAGAQSYFYYLGSLNNPNFNLTSVQWGTSGDLPVRGDFDGDGKADAAVYRSSNGIWYVRQSSNGQLFAVQFGLSTDKPVAGDYDGDGKTDVAVFRPSNGTWYIRQSSDGQVRSAQFGLGTDKLAAGDYDGDGKSDIAVWRDGVYYVLQSTNAQVSAQQFGAPTDTPVASAFVQ